MIGAGASLASFVAAVAAATSTGAPSVEAGKSPRITCSVPSIGVQGTGSLGASWGPGAGDW